MSAIFTRTARGAHGYCLIDIGYETRLTPPPEDYRNNNNNFSYMCVHGGRSNQKSQYLFEISSSFQI